MDPGASSICALLAKDAEEVHVFARAGVLGGGGGGGSYLSLLVYTVLSFHCTSTQFLQEDIWR